MDTELCNILKTEYSFEFDEKRKKAMLNSYYKYGPARKNYGSGNINAIATLRKCLDKYEETGNTEYLCDVANYAMLEFMWPQVQGAGYTPTTAEKDSAGIVGISVVEIEEYRRRNACESGRY